jgi:hypothetical protein
MPDLYIGTGRGPTAAKSADSSLLAPQRDKEGDYLKRRAWGSAWLARRTVSLGPTASSTRWVPGSWLRWLIAAVARGIDGACGCSSEDGPTVWTQSISSPVGLPASPGMSYESVG